MPNDPAARPRLCITTLDPYNRGGILALMKFVYEEAARDGFEPFLAYNRVPGVRGGAASRAAAAAAAEEFEGMRGVAVERVMPQFEFLNYVANRRAWRAVLERADSFFAVCGNALAALPLALARKPFSLWVASTLYEERVDRLRQQSFLRRLRDWLSLPILLRQERLVFRRADRILALSSYTRDAIVKKYPFTAGKMAVAVCPVDADFFTPAPEAEAAPARAREPYLLFTGRLNDERKNILMAIAAFARARERYPELRMKLVGGRPPKNAAALISALGLQDVVDVLPLVSREELRRLYRHASLFLVPSFQEGLCISGLESLACGVPVVSTRCGGPEEFMKDGVNGRLVPNRDGAAFADAIAELLALPPARRAELSAAARATVEERYVRGKVWPLFRECLTITPDLP